MHYSSKTSDPSTNKVQLQHFIIICVMDYILLWFPLVEECDKLEGLTLS